MESTCSFVMSFLVVKLGFMSRSSIQALAIFVAVLSRETTALAAFDFFAGRDHVGSTVTVQPRQPTKWARLPTTATKATKNDDDNDFVSMDRYNQQRYDGTSYSCSSSQESNPRRRFLLSSLLFTTNVIQWSSSPRTSWASPQTYAKVSDPGSVATLVPILQMQKELQSLVAMTKVVVAKQQQQGSDVAAANQQWSELENRILMARNPKDKAGIPTSEATFKALFDAYSEPVSYKTRFMDQNAFLVYYSGGFDGVGRPSLEASETDAEAKQKRQFGSRNDAWVAWDIVVASATTASSSSIPSLDVLEQDILEPLQETLAAVDNYLQETPVGDMERAKALLASSQ